MGRFDTLPGSPFPRLQALIEGVEPGASPVVLSLGEPQHPFPSFVSEIIGEESAAFGRYPPIAGTLEFRAAAHGWLKRRFGLAEGAIDPDRQILPVFGTREGLFLLPMIVTEAMPAGKEPAAILIPNPFYQAYAAAALAAGAEPVYVDATEETGHLPDFDALDPALLDRTACVFLCSPANPQGAVADEAYLKRLMALAVEHNFFVLLDECYADIYDAAAPPSGLNAALEVQGAIERVAIFHSLSKRSSVPGLRSGFVVGGPDLIEKVRAFRNVAGPQTPLPLLAAATALWNDDDHAAENRARYRAKIDIAERLLGNRFGFYRPPGGFFLWLDVGDGEAAARSLWEKAGVKVLPGAYLARENAEGVNPAARFIRVALVQDEETTEDALGRMARVLDG